MPFFLLIAGIILIVAAYRKKHGDLFRLLKEDFFGDSNFVMWTLSIVLLVSLGYIKQMKPITDAFLVLVILVIIVRNYRNNKDILSMFIEQIKYGTGDSKAIGKGTARNMISDIGINTTNTALNKARDLLQGILK